MLKLYNTKTLKKELFIPIKEKEVTMYVCGPTVYDHIHIGNARPVVVFDTLRRLLEALGYAVRYASNFTDVDDKIIKRSAQLNIDELTLTDEMINAYNKVRELLNTKPLYVAPRVTETMDEIITFIDDLVKIGAAYVVDGDVYFRVNSIKDYGSLSHQNLDDLKAGARIDENIKKESPLDFVLWKKTDFGIRWQSTYSLGRPGWHSECAVMINKYLGRNIDIHGGGSDLRFPHHENERSQTMALYGSGLANYWLHNGMLTFGGEKMSKSLGNLISSKEAIEKYGANTMRWLLISGHYRDSLPFTDETIDVAKKELEKVINVVKKANLELELIAYSNSDFDKESYDLFIEKMCDDLNTPNAFTVIFEIIKQLNQLLRVKDKDYLNISLKLNSLLKCLDILGIEIKLVSLDKEIKTIYMKWSEAKENKDFVLADEYRQQLATKGIL